MAAAPYILPVPPPETAGLAWLFLNDHPAAANPLVQLKVRNMLQKYRGSGWRVVTDDADIEVQIRKFLPAGVIDPDKPLPKLLRKTILDNDLAGILRITATPGEGAPHERIRWALIPAISIELADTEADEVRHN